MRRIGEECGIAGVYAREETDVAKLLYFSLFALQHRGQESCGIAVNGDVRETPETQTTFYKDLGLVSEVFDDRILKTMHGRMGIGHVRYSTTGSNSRENAQPLRGRYKKGNLVVAHNGNISNAAVLRETLEAEGAAFQTGNDTEVILFLLARARMETHSIEAAVELVIPKLQGSFSLLIMSPQKLIAVRDPYGIRPLCMGKVGSGTVFASESCALDSMNATDRRDVRPGEIIVVTDAGERSIEKFCGGKSALCIFEHLYFARPDSVIDGQSVYESRMEAGRQLSKLYPTDADVVMGVPDSGIIAAMGYAEASGIPYGIGLIKNRYIGRTFIQPSQAMREASVSIKLAPLRYTVRGRRIILVDDSIVRGTTMARIITMLKKAGAKEIHVRITAPEFLYPCFFGTDVGTRKQLISNQYSPSALAKLVGADSLGFLTVEKLAEIAKCSKLSYCDACFSGNYPFPVPLETDKEAFE